MFIRTLALAAALTSVTTFVHAAGLKIFEIPASAGGAAIKVAEWTPCARPPETIELGPFMLPAVRGCPIAGDKLPLIVLSHGFRGTNLSHHDTAEAFADAGFVVAALNHPDDSAFSAEKGRSLEALTNRPEDIKRVIDFMLGPSSDAAKIDPKRIGFFGFSRGGYTGLVLAGAEPDFRQLRNRCADPTGEDCKPIDPALVPTETLTRDPRIKAFVIADPLSSVFPTRESVRSITAPIQLWSSERGGDGVSPKDIAGIAGNLASLRSIMPCPAPAISPS
ncbi:dienelactone hydrolase [Aliirhizobium terrae]|uniref:alpha/beta hydrolase family protein n=1 Tax=Terrirhizobium terrae TaxID=2926709 RepID=UPI0025764807|nr:dienelactone hydrolase [Rhizobium sp. CC-CFT758]WJH39103.1 dienelactone hydrolase [Rhizobium sp. CC-CFT758]